MSGTDHSFGCKCGNCKGLIEAGNIVPLFIPNHEEIKMRKLLSQTKSKVVLEPSGQHLVVKDMTTDPSLVIDISTTSSTSTTLSSGETPVGRNLFMGGTGVLDNSMNIYTIESGTPVQKFSTAYKYGVNYDTDGSYISALYWLSQAATGSQTSRLSNYLSPIADFHEPPDGDPFGGGPGGGGGGGGGGYYGGGGDGGGGGGGYYGGGGGESGATGGTDTGTDSGSGATGPPGTDAGTGTDSSSGATGGTDAGTDSGSGATGGTDAGTDSGSGATGGTDTGTDSGATGATGDTDTDTGAGATGDTDTGSGSSTQAELYMTISVDSAATQYSSYALPYIAIPNPAGEAVALTPAFSANSEIYLSFYTTNTGADWFNQPTISHGGTNWDSSDYVVLCNADGTENSTAIWSDSFGGPGELRQQTSGTLQNTSESTNVNYQARWRNSLKLTSLDTYRGAYTVSVPSDEIQPQGAGGSYAFSATFSITQETDKPKMKIQVFDSVGTTASSTSAWTQEITSGTGSGSTFSQGVISTGSYTYPVVLLTSYSSTNATAPDPTPVAGTAGRFDYSEPAGSSDCPYVIRKTSGDTTEIVDTTGGWTIEQTSFIQGVDMPYQWSFNFANIGSDALPEAGVTYSIIVDASDLWTDVAGNKNVASDLFTFTATGPDLTRPTMTITATGGSTGDEYSNSSVTVPIANVLDTSYNVRFVVSEPTTDFVPNDVNLLGGSFNSSSFVESSGNTIFDISFVNTTSASDMLIEISVPGGQFSDAAGNTNLQVSALQLTQPGLPTPTLLITLTGASSGNEFNNNYITPPDTKPVGVEPDVSYNVRFVSSQPTTDFFPNDVTIKVDGTPINTFDSFNSTSFVISGGFTIFDISFINVPSTSISQMEIDVADGRFSNSIGIENTDISYLIWNQEPYPPPTMSITFTGGYSGTTYSTDNGSSFTGNGFDTSYNVRFISSAPTTDFVPSGVNLQNGTFNSSSFVTTGDNTIFDISFVNSISQSQEITLSVTVPSNSFYVADGQIPNTSSFSLNMNQPPYIVPTGSTTDPSLLPSYITGVETATSQRGSIPGVLAATTYPDLSNAYYKIDVVEGYFYTIETSVANPSVAASYVLDDLSLSIWTGDSANYFAQQVSYSANSDYTSAEQPAYGPNVSDYTTGYTRMNYPVDRRKYGTNDDVIFDPSAVQANGSIYLRVNDGDYNNNGYFNIVVKSVLLPDLPSVEVLAVNTITRGQIILDNVRNSAYDIWQITLTAGYQYRFTTSQFGASADTIMSLWNTEQDARDASGTALSGADASNDDGGANSYSQFLYPSTSTLTDGGNYYVRVEEDGQNADASYNILVEMASTNLTPYFDYNANTYASTQTDVSRCLLYGFGGPDTGTYTSSSLSPYFTSNGIPRAFTGILSSTGTLSTFTPNEIAGIKQAIYAWTEPMGMPSQELLDSTSGSGFNGTLDASANFKIYVVEASQLDSTYSGLEGLCYPPGYFGSNGVGQTILMEGYMLFVRSSGLYWSNSLKPGGYGYNVILHELGHGFGFAHPFDTGGGDSGVFPGVSAAAAGVPDQYQPYLLGDNSYNQIIVTTMAYSSTLQFTGFNFYLDPNGGGQVTTLYTNYEMLGTPTPLDVATLTSLYDYRRDASSMFIGMGAATFYLDASYRAQLGGADLSTNVFGWTTISIRLPPTGTTSETEYDGKLYIDAFTNFNPAQGRDASNDVVIDLRRTQVQMWKTNTEQYEGLTDPSLLCLSYLIPPGMIKENSDDEPYVDFNAMTIDGSGASYVGKSGCMISEFCSAPGGISAYGSDASGSSCMIYSNLGVATSSQDNASPNAAAGAFVGPGPGVLGRSKISGGKVVSGGENPDTVRTASVIYSKLDSDIYYTYNKPPDDPFSVLPTNWQNTYYFEIDDTSNRINVYLGSGSDYQTRYDATTTSTDGEPGKLPGYEEYYDEVVSNTISQFVFNNYDGTTSVIPTDVVCLAEGTEVMVWKPDTKKSFYKKIENITAADYVVTYGNGPKKVLGVMESYNFPVRVDNWHKKKIGTLTKNMAMYRLDPKDYPELKKELYLTGGHSLLKTKMSNHERTEMNKIDWPRKFRQIDGLWKVLTHVSENANPVYKVCKVYNMVLDQDDKTDMFKNYAIYANGMLVETCNIQHLHRAKKLNQMMKYDTNLKKSMTCRK